MGSTDRKQLIPWVVAAVPAVALVLCLLWILLHDCEDDASEVDGSGSSLPSTEEFVISGTTTRPIAPGVSAPINLSLTNRGDAAILVSGLVVTLSDVAAPRADAEHPCTVDDFRVLQAAEGLDLRLAAGETRSLLTLRLPAASWPRVQMVERLVNQDGCKESTLILDYSGKGTRAE